MTQGHSFDLAGNAVVCSCGYEAEPAQSQHDKVMVASEHQLAAFMRHAPAGEQVSTTCFSCFAEIMMPIAKSESLLDEYAAWIKSPCPACGRTPQDVVAKTE